MSKPPGKRNGKAAPLAPAAAALVAQRAKELQPLRRKLTHEYQARYAHLVPEWEIHDLGHDIANEAAFTFDPSSGAKITTYYWFLFGRRIVSLLEKHGYCKYAEPQGQYREDDGYSRTSTATLSQIADGSNADEPQVDPLTPFSINETWLADRSKTFIAIVVLIKEQLPEDKQIIWWADAMGRELSAYDLGRLGYLKGAPMSEAAIRKARYDANRKVEKIRQKIRNSARTEDHQEIPPFWFADALATPP